jgi:hypothetical protein
MFPYGHEKVPPLDTAECAIWLLRGEAGSPALRELLARSGIDALPEEVSEANVRAMRFTQYLESVPARKAFHLRSIPIPPSAAPLYLCIRVAPRDHLSCFLAAAALLRQGRAGGASEGPPARAPKEAGLRAALPIFLDVGTSGSTPPYRPGESAAFSPLFAGLLNLARDRVHAAVVADVLALDVLIPRLPVLQTLAVIAVRLAAADGFALVLPPCLLAAPRSLRTLVISAYERPTTCGTLHLPPSLDSLVLIEVLRPVREALFAALAAQNLAPGALHLHYYALVPAAWSDCIRVLGPALYSLTLRMDVWGRRDQMPRQRELDAFLAAVRESCPALRDLALHLSLCHSGDEALTFAPSLALPAALRALRLSVTLDSRRVSEGSCGGLLDLLAVAARRGEGGIEELAVDAHTTTQWPDEETPMALARAAAAVAPRHRFGLSLTSRESLPGTRNDPPGRCAWVIPLLALLPASLEHLALGFHTTLSGPYFTPAVLRAALRALPNLRTLDLDDDTNPCGEALLALLRELDGTFPLRGFPVNSDWLHRSAPAEAEVRRWAAEAREAAASRASWAQVRKSIERAQERRVAACPGIAFGSPGQPPSPSARRPSLATGPGPRAPMERLPCRALMTISDLLAYAPDPEVRADVFAGDQHICFK